MEVELLISGFSKLNRKVIAEVEVFWQERLCQRGQVDWMDELRPLDKVLELVNDLINNWD